MAPWEVFDLVSHHLDPKTLAIAYCLKLINPAVPYYRLYAIGFATAKRRFQTPSKPCLALDNLIFNEKNSINILSLEKPGNELMGREGVDWWFWEELPLPGCCSSLVDSGVVADLRLGITDRTSVGNINVWKINRVSVGMLSISKLKYVSVDDALRYLQHFLDKDDM
ncbi:hypothetical protein M0R45_030671 [Rubus argutus]|uniref:Uncharacterized protein n=1 Tax=Rubus argutus TaxID=59490 RepID=A0AAW1WC82_RUBAR